MRKSCRAGALSKDRAPFRSAHPAKCRGHCGSGRLAPSTSAAQLPCCRMHGPGSCGITQLSAFVVERRLLQTATGPCHTSRAGKDVVDTLPGPIQKVASSILRQVETSIYSDEPTSIAERTQLAEVLGGGPGGCRPGREDLSERQPWFAVVRRQQVTLERMEQHVAEMQEACSTASTKLALHHLMHLHLRLFALLLLTRWWTSTWLDGRVCLISLCDCRAKSV